MMSSIVSVCLGVVPKVRGDREWWLRRYQCQVSARSREQLDKSLQWTDDNSNPNKSSDRTMVTQATHLEVPSEKDTSMRR